MEEAEKKIHAGTSGWHYKHWMGSFYPKGMKQQEFMDYYLQFFRTVEINNSFYRLPKAETFAAWREAVPEDFLYAVKASRYITHMKKLKDPQASLASFFRNVEALQEKLGPILFQLPPRWAFNEERLASFLAALPKLYRYTLEFRDPSWYHPRVYELLRAYNVAFCIYELDYHLSPLEVTADFAYVRLHGPEGKYYGSYSESALAWWANWCHARQQEGKDVFVYFDNDINAYAPYNAKRLTELVQTSWN